MRILFIFLLSFPSLLGYSQSTKTDKKLEAQLKTALAGFRGDVGVYVRNLRTGKTVAINADSLFPTASTVKIPIQCGLFDKIHRGELTYNQPLVYKDSLHYDDGIVGSLKDGAELSLSKVVMLMETVSDNTGSLWCQALAGGGSAINQWLETNGFHQTRVNSRTPGRAAHQKQYGWGQTTPRELADLITYIREGHAVSPDASDEMYRNLGRQFWDNDGLSQLPPQIKTACKNGAVNQARSEVVLVHAPHGEYVYCVMTKNQKDESWERTNEGYALLRNVSSILWHHFEPKSTWKPPIGYEKWW
ncbi:serine hydrolase [Spirosoma utsteinense]|uniref:Beta-lactamase class A n=1 Tax=Spirosoma utsteinense TaxID=2585773 RepID=A0ABR6WAN5_9BACT|nr:serine hydrolase [Spirosoma utsteinense]MBC3786719.1 beta-lactamase class A [Spirosoma utsteinense]MBC3793339.1 beta-lactamase class A [Spirosoma utsteinense]